MQWWMLTATIATTTITSACITVATNKGSWRIYNLFKGNFGATGFADFISDLIFCICLKIVVESKFPGIACLWWNWWWNISEKSPEAPYLLAYQCLPGTSTISKCPRAITLANSSSITKPSLSQCWDRDFWACSSRIRSLLSSSCFGCSIDSIGGY